MSMDLLKSAMNPKAKEEDMQAKNQELLNQYNERVEKVNALEAQMEALSDEELGEKSQEFRARLRTALGVEDLSQSNDPVREKKALDGILEEAFAVVREAAWRVLELRHFDVQLVGGMAMHDGLLAEMATGEGKTLAATAPVYLNALMGKGAMVVSQNDYLTKRDSETMGQLYKFLGLSVGFVGPDMSKKQKREAYKKDVCYVSHQVLAFDYLYDNLAYYPDDLALFTVDRPDPLYFCLVDEADSILIDEGRNPLKITDRRPAQESSKTLYRIAADVVKYLDGAEGEKGKTMDFEIDRKNQDISLTEEGTSRAQRLCRERGYRLYDNQQPVLLFINNAVKAKALFEKDTEYIVANGNVEIIDQSTGRVLEGRRFTDGMHQSIEAKEGLDISPETKEIASVTYQALFRMFSRLSAMTGTAFTDFQEFLDVFNLRVVQIPTALPTGRRDFPDAVFKTRRAKLKALLDEIEAAHKQGRPLLIGTRSVALSEAIKEDLADIDIDAFVLNARPENADSEAFIIAQAGREGAITVATNMAGRGTDIILGGNPAAMARLYMQDALYKVARERRAEKGQSFIPTESQRRDPYRSLPLPDDFYPVVLSKDVEETVEAVAEAFFETWEDEGRGGPEGRLPTRDELDEVTAVSAGKGPVDDEAVLALRGGYEEVLDVFKEELAEEQDAVREMGGLYVVATEKHESRRIDNQLRGRAGRQGDLGASRFFLSLEDEIFKSFGADSLKPLMDAFRVGEDLPMESPQVTDALDKVQTSAEEFYFNIRRQVNEFDELIVSQRQSFYKLRREVMLAPGREALKLAKDFSQAGILDLLDEAGNTDGSVDPQKLAELTNEVLCGVERVSASDLKQSRAESRNVLSGIVDKAIVKRATELEKARRGLMGDSFFPVVMAVLDVQWSNHLENIAQLKQTIAMRESLRTVYRGREADMMSIKSPLQEFQSDSGTLYKQFENRVARGVLRGLMKNSLERLLQIRPRPDPVPVPVAA